MAWFQTGIICILHMTICLITGVEAQTLTIDSVPKSPVRVNVGESLTLDISYKYTGSDIVAVEWKNASGKVLIRKSPSGKIFPFDPRALLKDAGLVLNDTRLNDNGTYGVELKAADVSSPAKKTVVVIVQVRSDVSINCSKESKTGGETVKCDCTTSNGNPPPWVRWYKDGTPVDGHDAEYEKSTLTLTDIKKNDAGTYTCRATSGTLVTNEPKQLDGPKNTRFTNSNSTYVGAKNFKITCKADGNPEATYTLSYDGEEITKNVIDGVYTIATVNDSHGGSYSCVAKNFGSETASFELYVSVTSPPPTVSTAATSNSTSSTDSSDEAAPPDGDSGGLGTGPIIGIVVGVLALIVFIVLLWYCCCRKPGDKDRVSNPDTDDERPSGSMPRNDENAYETPDKPPRASASRDSPPAQPANQPPLYSQVDKSRKTKKAPPTASPALTYAALDPVALQPDSSRMRERPNEDTQYADLQNLQGDLV